MPNYPTTAVSLTLTQQSHVLGSLSIGNSLQQACADAECTVWDFGFTLVNDIQFKVDLDTVVAAMSFGLAIDLARDSRRADNPRANDARRLWLNIYAPIALNSAPPAQSPST